MPPLLLFLGLLVLELHSPLLTLPFVLIQLIVPFFVEVCKLVLEEFLHLLVLLLLPLLQFSDLFGLKLLLDLLSIDSAALGQHILALLCMVLHLQRNFLKPLLQLREITSGQNGFTRFDHC